MAIRLNYMWALLALQVVAFYPVWGWFIGRITDTSDEPWGLMAIVVSAALIFLDYRRNVVYSKQLILPALITLAHGLTFPFVPHLIRAFLAVTAIGCTISVMRYGSAVHLPMWGLLVLSLPVVPSLQFYFGYPIRLASGAIAAPLLQISGFAVEQEGSCLRYGGELLAIDAPCSGVHMLWTGLFLAFSISWLRKLNNWQTITFTALTFIAAIPANGLRAATLFFVKSAPGGFPNWYHEAVGLIVFALFSIGILWQCCQFRGDHQCET
jgi:exosortase/archaeosortase family protein